MQYEIERERANTKNEENNGKMGRVRGIYLFNFGSFIGVDICKKKRYSNLWDESRRAAFAIKLNLIEIFVHSHCFSGLMSQNLTMKIHRQKSNQHFKPPVAIISSHLVPSQELGYFYTCY